MDSDHIELQLHVSLVADGVFFAWHTPGGFASVSVPSSTVTRWKQKFNECELEADIGLARSKSFSLGEDLFQVLFTTEACQAWNRTLKDQIEKQARLLIFIPTEIAAEFSSVPFEFMRRPAKFHTHLQRVVHEIVGAPNVSLARNAYTIQNTRTRELMVIDPPLRILVIASQPTDLKQGDHLHAMQNELTGMRQTLTALGDNIHLKIVEPGKATFASLCEDGASSHIIHFIGHGKVTPDGSDAMLCFEDRKCGSDWRHGSELAAALLLGQTRLFVLNGCETAAAAVLACRFPAVIGNLLRIQDSSASLFAGGLYARLSDTGQLDDAMTAGRQSIYVNSNIFGWERIKPAIYMDRGSGLLLLIRPVVLKDLPDAHLDCEYQAALSIRGGRRSYDIQAEGLPPGLALDARTGQVSGKPSAVGEFHLRLRVTSRDQQFSQSTVSLRVLGGGGFSITTKEIG